VVAFLSVALIEGPVAFGLAVARLAMVVAALALGRFALGSAPTAPLAGSAVGPAEEPVLIVNPRSGGGKADRVGLAAACEARGIRVITLEPGSDLRSLAEAAVDGGADAIGMAGGDGSQAIVAAVAAQRDLPMVLVPAGTRNHFALDLGLDRDDPAKALDALGPDGVEVRIDLGRIGDRPFVNNVSLGAYAEIISDPKYRDAKLQTVLSALPDVAGSKASSGLGVRTPEGEEIRDPNLIQVGNNPYDNRSLKNAGRRPRLDTGQLGVDVVRFSGSRELRKLIGDLQSGRNRVGAIHTWTAPSITVTGREGEVAAGVDGEYLTFPSPLEIACRPGVLRIRVPARREPPLTQRPRGLLETLRSLWSVAAGSEPDLEVA
jgi:diacylglycerol kinase family enzyme